MLFQTPCVTDRALVQDYLNRLILLIKYFIYQSDITAFCKTEILAKNTGQKSVKFGTDYWISQVSSGLR